MGSYLTIVTVCKISLTIEKPCYNSPMFNKPNKVQTMSDNAKFILGLAYIAGMVALGFVLIAAYFDVLVK